MRLLLSACACLMAIAVSGQGALAQSPKRIFDVPLGSPVSKLPSDLWVDPSCGTNGGPPSIRLDGFEAFARCRTEPDTGLHEVWFIYDDEWEYIARAYRDAIEIGRYSANTFYGQPIITSLLIDDGGLVQGYRVVTDPRAPEEVRLLAHTLTVVFKAQYGTTPWQCVDLPPQERETPVDGTFVKQDCASVSADRYVKVQGRLLRKPGQGDFSVAPQGYFESSARLEVYSTDAVRGAPCCQATAPR
jgi:hypothetical protein